MALSFGQLTNLLSPAQDGSLRVPGSAFDTPAVEWLFVAYLGGTLELTGVPAPTVAPDTQTVTVTGTLAAGSVLAFPGGQVTGATFVLRGDGTVAATIPVGVAGEPWPLSQAFPALSGGVFDAILCGGATLTLDSTVPTTLPPDFRSSFGYPPDDPIVTAHTFQGLTLTAALTFAEPLGPDLAPLFAASIEVSGPVAAYVAPPPTGDPPVPAPPPGPAVQMLLRPTGTPGKTVTVGSYSLPFSIEVAALLQEFPSPDGKTVGVVPAGLLAVTTQFDTGAVDAFPISVQIYDPSASRIVMEAGSPPTATFKPDALGQMLDGTSASSLLAAVPSGFPLVENLQLTGATVTLDRDAATGPSIEEITLALDLVPGATGSTWTVFDIVDVTDVGFRVAASSVGGSLAPSATVFADGQLHGNEHVKLAVTTTLPDLTFTCELDVEGESLDLSKIAEQVLGDPLPLPTLTGGTFAVGGDYTTGAFTLQAAIQETWTLAGSGESSLELDGFGLTLQHDGTGTSGSVFGNLTFSGRELLVSASYAKPSWTFDARTLPGPAISLTGLVGDVLQTFGIDLTSAVVPSISIADLELMVTPQPNGATAFEFDCRGSVTLLGQEIDVAVDLSHGGAPASTTFTGTLGVAGQSFTADFTSTPGDAGILFEWDPSGPLDFGALAAGLGVDLPEMPGGLELDLESVSLYYEEKGSAETLAVSAKASCGQISFVRFTRSQPQDGDPPPATLLSLSVPLDLNFGRLRVAGEMLPAGTAAGVEDVQVVIAWDALSGDDVKTANAILAKLKADPLPAETMLAGATFGVTVTAGSPETIALPLGSGSASPALAPALSAPSPAPAPATGSSAGAKWLPVNTTLGPVSIERVGVQYQSKLLSVLLDASLELGALTIGLDGLGIGSGLSSFDPQPQLSGLSIGFAAGPVTVSGGFVAVPASALPAGFDYEYDGELTVAAEEWTLAAVGGYGRRNGRPAFFLFGEVEGDFGGPPSFYLTGLMGGLGYDFSLTIPAPDQVASFPFVANLGGGMGPPDQILDTLTGTSGGTGWLVPADGTFWGAVGIEFRSFELVVGNALLVIEVGHDVEIALLGKAGMSLPQGSTDGYAYVELQMEAVLEPDQGYFGVTASLTPASYLLTSDCHLTGGFAFCTWFGDNEHAGDFVLTAGGYHPAFPVPTWYPQVAPVGFDWQVTGDVTVSGAAYFALTPSALMAGGNLLAAYQSGDLHAWFSAWANALITWKPFHFEAEIGISIGASYRLNLLFTTVTLSVELGAQLDLWGPPTGGVAHVDWYVISFSVSFGADPNEKPSQTLEWGDFADLLPGGAKSPILAAQANAGVIRQDAGEWTVRPDEFAFTFASTVPASAVTWGPWDTSEQQQELVQSVTGGGIQIRPMNLQAAVTSGLNVDVAFDDGTRPNLSQWTVGSRVSNLPGSLWGKPLGGDDPPATNDTVESTVGARLTPPPAAEGPSPGPVDMAKLTDTLPSGPRVLDPASQPAEIPAPVAGDSIDAIASAFDEANLQTTEKAQQDMVTALAAFGAEPACTGTTAGFATEAFTAFAEAPMVVAG